MGIFDGVKDFFSGIGDTVTNVAKTVVSPLAPIFGNSDKYITAIGNKAGDIIDKVIDVPGKIVDTVGNVGTGIVNTAGGVLNKGLDILSSPFTFIFLGVGAFLIIMLLRK